MDAQIIRPALDATAHLLEHIDEPDVALEARGAKRLDLDATSGDGRRGQEIRRVRRVGLDRVLARAVALRGGHDETGRRPGEVVHDGHAEIVHQSRGHGQVGGADDPSADLDEDVAQRVRGDDQDRTDELA